MNDNPWYWKKYWPFYYALGTALLFFSLPFIEFLFFKTSLGDVKKQVLLWDHAVFFLILQLTAIFFLKKEFISFRILQIVLLGYFMGSIHFFYKTEPFLQQTIPEATLLTEVENIEKRESRSILTCVVKSSSPLTGLKRIIVLLKFPFNGKKGDTLKIKGTVMPLKIPFPDSYTHTHYRLKGVQAQIASPCLWIAESVDPLLSFIEQYQQKIGIFIDQTLLQTSETAAAFVKALILGDTSHLPKNVKREFSYSGLSHLLAISGLHMTIIIGLLYSILYCLLCCVGFFYQRLSLKKMIFPLALSGGAFYLMISGCNPPAQRAFAMACIVLLSLLSHQPLTGLQRLLSAVGLLLLLNPFLILHPSFQLSFMAVLGIVTSSSNKTDEKKFHFLHQSINTTLRATFATLPLCSYYFDQLPLYTIAANLLAVPLVSIIIMPLIGLTAIFPSYPSVLCAALSLLQEIAHFFAILPDAILQTPPLSPLQTLFLTTAIALSLIYKKTASQIGAFACIFITITFSPAYKTLIFKDFEGTLYPSFVKSPGVLYVKDLHHPLMVNKLLKYSHCSVALPLPNYPWKSLETLYPEGGYSTTDTENLLSHFS